METLNNSIDKIGHLKSLELHTQCFYDSETDTIQDYLEDHSSYSEYSNKVSFLTINFSE